MDNLDALVKKIKVAISALPPEKEEQRKLYTQLLKNIAFEQKVSGPAFDTLERKKLEAMKNLKEPIKKETGYELDLDAVVREHLGTITLNVNDYLQLDLESIYEEAVLRLEAQNKKYLQAKRDRGFIIRKPDRLQKIEETFSRDIEKWRTGKEVGKVAKFCLLLFKDGILENLATVDQETACIQFAQSQYNANVKDEFKNRRPYKDTNNQNPGLSRRIKYGDL